jgi:hypothetical protein
VTELDAKRIEGDRVSFSSHLLNLAFRDKQELSLVVYKARDQPGAGYAVYMNVRTGNPQHLVPPH